ncbi:peptidoglycan -binding protein [Gluconacetobacter azotocaptans]|uniref:Peptidoglycan -binding protein n=1 Tax=Gluconacetobacter azotocaptans TaxID=142834 RepID=A0A7W4JV18_9PROT|nr:peptidoglycan -binding protein [Gluconacetobacter azotocaptans]MBB2191330.1 peptidoglycan -binding protein [Gluconacetobacter azotocaptans]MBM9402474.1 peptidoglycan -binding protein [Gluconacetobacter azotocaptans]GBQ29765.1 flagellar motor protein [Gluconacetobacter azotocaptans DSM 13594]
MARRRRQTHAGLDAWPGYVDALSTLLMVIIFVLLVFVLGQAFLSVALNKRQRAMEQLAQQVAQLNTMLSLERGHAHALELSVASLRAAHEKDEAMETSLTAQVAQSSSERDNQARLAQASQQQVADLGSQLEQIRQQLSSAMAALEISQTEIQDRQRKIDDLGLKLNVALADKVEQLQRYRSEFFGRLRDILKNQEGVQVVGDRFVFQSEVLFPPGGAELSPKGVAEIRTLARTFHQVSAQIPASIPWIMRVDGHADRQPIHSAFASNWELSSARAITVVKLLIAEGISPHHLAATGFADFQPLDAGNSQTAFARNRRIEFRLTDR